MMRGRRLPYAAFLLGILLTASGVPATETGNGQLRLPSLAIGYSASVISNVDPGDAKAATKVWADMIMRRKGAIVESETMVLKNLPALEKALKEKRVDLIFLLPQEYLEARDRLPIVPLVASTPKEGLYEEFVLLVRKDSALATVRDLRRKRLTVETDQKGTLPLMWLETLLMREGEFEDIEQYFAGVKATHKPSQTILPVFFRQADGCIVTRTAFQTMVELNPQLGKEIREIAISPPFITSIGCLRQDYYDKYKEVLTEHLVNLHEDPQGKQILTLFRKGRLVLFEPPYLASVDALVKEHNDLRLHHLARGK
ncbi:MAG: phosphate/phosphite/phosphonate ABC transporter substrate-binding protein [Deltaproteobacteria bacterium]|nr:phosphate/phosphite/phosphonate ABC transporter substrate-binding protein [Deltaproteobacteria bacterium]MDH3382531.1 phosphate/phosphite/phosphonate ABC transporter substrate-binding protein [Deltaproteobacteria bacterium]